MGSTARQAMADRVRRAMTHLKEVDLVRNGRILDSQQAASDIRMTCNELGGRCHGDVCAQCQGLLEDWGHDAVVHHHKHSSLHPDMHNFNIPQSVEGSSVLMMTVM